MSDYQPGAVVKLRSGSPDMTVQRVMEDGSLLVAWLDEALHINTFVAPAMCFGLRRNVDGTDFAHKPMIKSDRAAFFP